MGDGPDGPAVMSGDVLTIELLLRGAAVGALVLLAMGFASRRPLTWRHGLGAAFAIGTASYLLNSSQAFWEAAGRGLWPVQLMSIAAPALFWWFSLALFDDGFRLRWPYLLPMAAVAQTFILHPLKMYGTPVWTVSLGVAHAAMAAMYVHTIYTALRFLNDDLLEGRRRFRVVFSIAVAAVGLFIVYAEAIVFRSMFTAPVWVYFLQSGGILVLTLGFALWLLEMRVDVLDGRPLEPSPSIAPPPVAATALRAADRPAYARLVALMDEGVWKEEGLTVAALAAKVGVPEHQLRALINGQLGFRNFSAFLGERRIAAAKVALSDPHQARRQVLQIALDVGFGSIAPFNRAFKEATGKTPT